MKSVWTAVLLAALLVGCDRNHQIESAGKEDVVPSDLTSAERALLQDVHGMFQRDDISGMLERVHKIGVEDWWMEIEAEYLNDILEKGMGRLELVRINPPRTSETLPDGSVVQWSLPLKWQLLIFHPPDGSGIKYSHTISLSDHEGRLVSIRKLDKGEQVDGPER